MFHTSVNYYICAYARFSTILMGHPLEEARTFTPQVYMNKGVIVQIESINELQVPISFTYIRLHFRFI